MKDANNQPLAVGDTVLLARTSKSAGIHWRKHVITRMTAHSYWTTGVTIIEGRTFEDGPYKLANCVKVEA